MTSTQHIYRDVAIIAQASAGHFNVTRRSDGGFVGGYRTLVDAKRAVDKMLDRPSVVQVGPNSYRIISATNSLADAA